MEKSADETPKEIKKGRRRPTPELTPTQLYIQEGVKALATGLTHPDEECRQSAVSYVREQCLPDLQAMLIERLVTVLKYGEEAASNRAAASLAQLGPQAFSMLCQTLQRSRATSVQFRFLEALAVMAPGLAPSDRLRLRSTLLAVWPSAGNDEVRKKIATLIAEQCVGSPETRASLGVSPAKLFAVLRTVDTLASRGH